jgi:phage repressor protein C with HTH and peptisase S24 domain
MKVSARLRALRECLGLTQPEAAIKFHIPLPSWKSNEKGPSEPGAGALRNLANGGVNIHWLLTGEGEPLLEKERKLNFGQTHAELGAEVMKEYNLNESIQKRSSELSSDLSNGEYLPENHQEQLSVPEDFASSGRDTAEAVWSDFALVPVYDVQASAGHGSLVESELQTGQLAFKKSWLKEKGLQVGHLAIITAKGDSMEQTICDGDTLLVDTRVDRIIDDSIYIIQADSHLIVKRLQQDFDGSVFVISDNPRYEKRHLNPEQAKNLKIAGRVCWYGHEI